MISTFKIRGCREIQVVGPRGGGGDSAVVGDNPREVDRLTVDDGGGGKLGDMEVGGSGKEDSLDIKVGRDGEGVGTCDIDTVNGETCGEVILGGSGGDGEFGASEDVVGGDDVGTGDGYTARPFLLEGDVI